VLFLMTGLAAVGFADDYIKIFKQRSTGLRARTKLVGQAVVSLVFAILVLRYPDNHGLTPASHAISFVRDSPWVMPLGLFLVWVYLMVAATSNGVNLTDGLDGLAGGTLIFAFVAYMIIALLNVPNQANLGVLCALIIGGLLGFLWFNVHPAQIFMGDSGSLSLGATLAVTALITGQILILPLIGIVFVAEAGSVILQVLSIKIRHKRIFRFSPIHHHFELGGWDEEKITMRFWIVGVLAAMVGVVFFLATVDRLR
jgi:phospho-N-acetylmuramoyl-pentapeptide-transferase